MEDDEEYSYKGYSAETASRIRQHDDRVTLVGDEEEYSFKGFSDETAVAEAEQAHGYGDFIIEEFSTETNVKRVTALTKLSETTVNYAFAAVYFVVGLLCVGLTKYILVSFPYIVGGFMALIGLVQFISAIRTKEYVHTHSNKTATSLILMALSVMIIVEYDWANTFIAIAWGFLGLLEGAHAFNHAFSRIARSERCVYYLGKGMIELVLAFMLLYEPSEHIELHIIIFGIQLIFDAITMLPVIKNFLSRA